MSATRAARGRSPASLIGIANAYAISPTAAVPVFKGPVATGNNPPQVFMTGAPTSGSALFTGKVQVTITLGGPFGTAMWSLFYNGAGVATGTTAAVVPIGVGGGDIGVVLYFEPGTYDTTHSWTWVVGITDEEGTNDELVAVGQTPVDIDFNLTIADSAEVRLHGARTVTLPANPWDGMRCAILDANGTALFGAAPQVAVLTGQSLQNPDNLAQIVAGPTNFSWTGMYRRIEWVWDQAANLWRVAADNRAGMLPSSAISSGTSNPAGRLWVKCSPSGAITVNLPVTVEEGLQIRVSDISGGASVHNITIQANVGAGWSVEVQTLGGPGGSDVISTNYKSVTYAADNAAKVWRLVGIN